MQKANEQNKKTEASEKADRQWFRSVGLRVLTALVSIPIVLAVLWLGGWWAFAAAVLATVLAISELRTMMLHEGYQPVILVSFALSLLFLVAAMLPKQRLPLLEVGISLALLISFPTLFFRKKLEGAMVDWSLTMAIAIYLGWPMSYLLILRGSQVGLSDGLWWLFTLFGGVWGFDTGAFFAGHFLVATSCSSDQSRQNLGRRFWRPGFLYRRGFAVYNSAYGSTLVSGGAVWIVLGVAAVLGDLAESLIKRQTHVKDSGQIHAWSWRHAGSLDSILFAVLVVYIFALLAGKLL